MSEKIILAVILTFSFNLFAQMSLSSPSQGTAKVSLHNQEVLALTEIPK
ncbi:hypothetical protein [Cylindrospermum sp. FACHB-282]|nr:hypothetical protein [Cylindrospermum sp. FACHB-282]MBD2387656.1 hypothetical protein [Cylindrospermum sp. FACHB-282]